jgi:hypothetical protein
MYDPCSRSNVRKVCLPSVLNAELQASDLHGPAKDVVFQIVEGCLTSREYSHPFNVKILTLAIGRRQTDAVSKYLNGSRFFRAASGGSYKVGAACRRYEVLCDRECDINPMDKTLSASAGGIWTGDVVYRSIDFGPLMERIQTASERLGYGQSIKDAVNSLEHIDIIVLTDQEIRDGAKDYLLAEKPRASRKKIKDTVDGHLTSYRRFRDDPTKGVKRQNGRTYTTVTNLPRWIRRKVVRFKGAAATVDVSACYPWLLAAEYRQRLIRDGEDTTSVDSLLQIITSGRLYAELAERAKMPYGTPSEQRAVKAQTQQFCLFGRIGVHPLWWAMQELCPGFCQTIQWWRKQPGGATRLSNRLQRLEGQLMTDGIVRHLAELNVPVVQIHDAVIVPIEYAEQSERWLKDHSRELWGTECRVKVEITA